jgi:uncharacterized membrane protein
MELPALKLPAIHLPFDIPVLAHPPVDHFVIAIPILVLVIEIINLVAKKRAIGTIAFVLLVIGMVAAVAAYLTGTTDGKEAFDALTQAGQAELKEHKLLGTYLMFASAIVVVFKMLSAMIRRGLMKAVYLLVLIVFVAGILKQGHDGGELVYKYGANVERVADLDSDLFDAKEELDDANDQIKSLKEEMKSTAEKAKETVNEAKQAVTEAAKNTAEKAAKAVNAVKQTAAEAANKGAEVAEQVTQSASEAVEAVKAKAAEMTQSAPAPEVEKVAPVTPQSVPVETH